ncbi:MAG: hypothetical protein ABIL22_06795, partial [candidate division WOR-3 bacterium]
WTLAYNERLFYQFNDYYKFSSEEVLSILETECRFFENILEEIKPDFLIMLDTSMHHNHLFYEICKSKGVKPLLLVATRLARRWAISSIADNVDFLPNKLIHSKNNRSFEELRNYLKSFDTFQLATQVEKRFLSSKISLVKAAIQFLFQNKNINIKTHYSYYGRTKLKVLIKSIANMLKTKYRESFINHNFVQKINHDHKFIYFPLHQEPERSLLLTAPFYTNEFEVVTNIVKSLPIGYRLYVKEHPAMKSREWRKISYYKQLMGLPNVVMIHPSVKPSELMEKCSLVITISGTASFEASFYQKPSIVFSDTSFSVLSSVYKLRSIEELPYAIRLSLKKNIWDSSELNEYVNILMKNTFEFDYHKLALDLADLFYYGSFLVDVEISESKMKDFMEENKLLIQQLATEHIKKINNYKNSVPSTASKS